MRVIMLKLEGTWAGSISMVCTALVMDAVRVHDAARVMAKERTAVEGARVKLDGVRDQDPALENAGPLGLLAMSGLAHAWRLVVTHLDARGVWEAS